jgi:hypothetical protein
LTCKRRSFPWRFGLPCFWAVVAFWDSMFAAEVASTVVAPKWHNNFFAAVLTLRRVFQLPFLLFLKVLNTLAV